MRLEMSNKHKSMVDTRVYKRSGLTRQRYYLSEAAYDLVISAFNATGYKHFNTCLDKVSINFLAGHPPSLTLRHPAHGKKRLIIRLHEDEYETVRYALDQAREYTETDADALVIMCSCLLNNDV